MPTLGLQSMATTEDCEKVSLLYWFTFAFNFSTDAQYCSQRLFLLSEANFTKRGNLKALKTVAKQHINYQNNSFLISNLGCFSNFEGADNLINEIA